MNDYIFFAADLRDQFLDFVRGLGIEASTRPDRIEGFVVAVPDMLADEVESAIEDRYDVLMAEQQDRIEAEDDEDRTLMGVHVTLPDGDRRVIRLPAEYSRRLCAHFTTEEIQDLVAAIAQSVLDPIDGPLCRGR